MVFFFVVVVVGWVWGVCLFILNGIKYLQFSALTATNMGIPLCCVIIICQDKGSGFH